MAFSRTGGEHSQLGDAKMLKGFGKVPNLEGHAGRMILPAFTLVDAAGVSHGRH